MTKESTKYPEEGSIVREIGRGPDSCLYYLDHYFSEHRDVIFGPDGKEMVSNGMNVWDREEGSNGDKKSEEDIAYVRAVTLHQGEYWFVPESVDTWSVMGDMNRNSLEVVKPKGPCPKTLDEKICRMIQKMRMVDIV